MKKVAVLLLAVVMLVGLCACSTVTEADFAGTWSVAQCECGYYKHLGDFRLLPSGRAIFNECSDDDKNANPIIDITERAGAFAAEWELDGNRIYIFYENLYASGADADSVYILQIVDETTLTSGKHTYKRSQ